MESWKLILNTILSKFYKYTCGIIFQKFWLMMRRPTHDVILQYTQLLKYLCIPFYYFLFELMFIL